MDAVEFLHREAFTAPADEEPEAAGEYEELEEAVEDGNLRAMLIFPTGGPDGRHFSISIGSIGQGL